MSVLSLIKEKVANQFYLPVEGGETTVDAEDLKAGLTAKVKERVSPYNGGSTVVHLDLEIPGFPRQSVKVAGTVVEAMRDKKVDFAKIKVSVESIVITKLKKTDSASKEMREFIERANFDWSI